MNTFPPELHLLFVCTANLERSPTAEYYFKSWDGIQVKSAGTALYAKVTINKELLKWADQIFVMEKIHQEIILERFYEMGAKLEEKLIVLGIDDIYSKYESHLIEIIKERTIPYLPRWIRQLNKEKI